MRVKEIVIDGFKSYAKRTVVTSWDPQFNCITGLNGSGKSNILDAICFVLGITTMSTVRAHNQQDLIYKRGQAGVTKASVSIVFDNLDKSKSPLDYVEVDNITVTRQVVLGGTSKYLVNGHRAQQAQVQQLFQEVQLNVNNPNFLIMQGQITKVVNMRPTEILGLIEEAAGTGMYEKERLKAIKEIRDRDAPLYETESLLNEEVRPKLEKLRSQKRQFLEYQQCAASTEALEKIVAISEYNYHKQRLGQLEEEASNREVRTEELREQLRTDEERHSQLETMLDELKLAQQSEESAKLDAELQAAKEEQARVGAAFEHKQEQLRSLERQEEHGRLATDKIRQQLTDYEAQVHAFESEHASLRKQLEKYHGIVAERRELLTGLQTGISTTGDKETGYAYTTKRARNNLAEAKQTLASLHAERDRLASSSELDQRLELEREIANNEARLEEIQKTESSKKAELAQMAESAEAAKSVKKTCQEQRDKGTAISREVERLMARFPNLEVPGQAQNPEVRGRVVQLFDIADAHKGKSLALEVCAGASLWSLVVDNERIGAKVLKNARKRLTVLPLNRMRSQPLSRDFVKKIDPEAAWLAVDLLQFEERVRPAIDYVFGRTVICATSSVAERAAFKFGVRSVTLEGDVFDPRGVISGGFQGVRNRGRNDSGGSSVFNAVADFKRLTEQRLTIETELADLESRLESMGKTVLSSDQTRNELALVAHEQQITQGRLSDLKAKLRSIDEISTSLEQLTLVKIPEAEKSAEAAQMGLASALKDAAEFNANRDGKLQELQTELERAVAAEATVTKELDARSAQHSKNQQELTKLRADLNQESDALKASELMSNELRSDIEVMETTALPQLADQIASIDSMLKEETTRVASTKEEMLAAEKELLNLKNSIADMRLELQHAAHSQENEAEALAGARSSLNQVTRRWSWVAESAASPEAFAQLQGLSQSSQSSQILQFTRDTSNNTEQVRQLEQLRHNFAQEQRRLQSLASRVDSGVVSMIERLEKDEEQLRHRLDTIREDRRKLEESMETLNERRRRTIDNVWKQVSKDFGLIFGDLLPNSSCELVPLGGSPIEHGFSLKVRLGSTWKDGLTELSGGQRSLVALSLILALLRYHPAPVYILDEVDAALDVHHTRNIGQIIKTRFQSAQFIVVSLKDDMFTNANRIYQTRFVDGTSTVAIMV